MKALIHTYGTSGDNRPFYAIGSALKARGIVPLMLVNPSREAEVRERGLEFRPCGEWWTEESFDVERFLHPIWGGSRVWKELCVPNLKPAFEAGKRVIEEEKPEIYVGHFLCWGGLWAAREAKLRTVLVTLAPSSWYSRADPSVYGPSDPPPFATGFSMWLAAWLTERFLRVPGKSEGYFETLRSADLNIGLWSPSFRGPAPDDPPNGAICGFAFDVPGTLDPEVDAFLSNGDPPLVVGLGTSARGAGGAIYRLCAEAARELGLRALLIGSNDTDLAGDGIMQVKATPYSLVFPRARAIVHHGGVGTTADALRAGRPSVIIPFAYDQFDNARRSEKAGCAVRVPRASLSKKKVRNAIERALELDASKMGALIRSEPDGAITAAERIAALMRVPA